MGWGPAQITAVAREQVQSILVANPDQPKFDAIASSLSTLSVALTVGAIVIGLLAIVVTIVVGVGGYQWSKLIIREAKADARDEANTLISAFIANDAPRIVREGAAGLQSSGLDIDNSAEHASDEIGEAAG